VVYRRLVMWGGKSAAWVGLGLWLSGCPGIDPPGVLDDGPGTGGSTSTGPNITTFNSTLDPTLPPDGGSMEAESTVGTTMGVVDDTTTEPGTTSTVTGSTTAPGSSSTDSSSTASSSTASTTDSSTTGSSSSESTTGDVCNGVPGNYGSCVDMGGAIDTTPCMAPGDATCIYTGMLALPSGDVCAVQDCVDACDCPGPPATGTAVVSCGDVTDNPAELFCYLNCSGGATCPTGMACVGDFCVWPGPGAAGTPYGDCFNEDGVCSLTGVCLGDGAMTIGVCADGCAVVGDCPASPGGTAPVACQDLTGDTAPECFLNCSGGGTCPAGMTCFSSTLCAWN